METHSTGVDYLLAPFSVEHNPAMFMSRLERCITCLASQYDYIVVDLEASFSPDTSAIIQNCEYLVHVLASTVPSVSASTIAFEGYKKLEVEEDHIFVIGSQTTGNHGLTKAMVEKALKCSVDAWIPWALREFTTASNEGEPIVTTNLHHEATHAYQDLALLLSKPIHLQIPPTAPSEMWRQLQHRRASLLSHGSKVRDDKNGGKKSVLNHVLKWF